jgi:large subunit ribosomal protein L4
MKLDVVVKENKKLEEIEVADSIMEAEVNMDLIHDVVLAHLANQHTGSSNTKTRAEVRGGGAKPWKQKGTGRSRHGSNRSPIWTGGGVTFGPRPRKVRLDVNKKIKKQALLAVVAGKIKDNEIVVINSFGVTEPKTRAIADIMKTLGIKGKALIVVDVEDKVTIKSARNLGDVKVVTSKNINVYELLNHPKVLLTKKSMEDVVGRIS